MGKSNKKKKKTDYDLTGVFDSKDDGGWVSGVSAMALDEEGAGGEDGAPVVGAGKDHAGEAMDTAEAGPKGAKGGALGVNKASMKAVRGNRTKAQKQRKAKLVEKAAARADKVVVRVNTKSSKKAKKVGLKGIY